MGQASQNVYKEDFKKDIIGKSAANPAIAYPEHDRLKKIKDATSKPIYEKDAKQALQKNILSIDTPEFNRAKEAALNASDREYKRKLPETIAKYRGYQTMEAKEHPDVKKATKANELTSEKIYKDDYESSKELVYFPYTITQEYDTKSNLKRHSSEYNQDYDKTKDKNHYDVTSTLMYSLMKEQEETSSDIKYKGDYEKNKGHMLGTDETPEMTRARELYPIQSKQTYAGVAKAALAKSHVAADGQEITHATNMTKQASLNVYKEDFKKDIIGKSAANPAIAYPEHDRLKKIKDATSKPKYEKDAKEALKKNIYHVDAPAFVRSTEAAKNACDRDYKKKMPEVTAKYRGYQTMEAKEHPDVKKANANDLTSDLAYREDYEDTKDMVYFPYTIT